LFERYGVLPSEFEKHVAKHTVTALQIVAIPTDMFSRYLKKTYEPFEVAGQEKLISYQAG
jgi:hypothetical protein